ncbi:MAG: hypothetical protein AAGM22_33720, partial [Acidobacteriota bacterium]
GEAGRLESTRGVLQRAGCKPGAVFGDWTDREAYRIILEQDLAAVQAVVEEVAGDLLAESSTQLVSDAVEGFNAVHDLCYVIAESAVAIASRRAPRPLEHLFFPLEAAPAERIGDAGAGRVQVCLDASALERKLEAARAYPELRAEVDRAVLAHSTEGFGVEVLTEAAQNGDLLAMAAPRGGAPSYEVFGERRVADGIYRQVLRLQEHWWPLARSIRRWARTQ